MGHPTKVQLIQRKNGPDQWYVNFPPAIAQAMEFAKGETVEWVIEDKSNVILHRRHTPASPVAVKKTTRHFLEASSPS